MMSDMTREQYEALALERLAELARSENERIALEAARTMLAHLRLTSPQRHGDTEDGNRGRWVQPDVVTQIGADVGTDRGGTRDVSPMDVSAEENPRSSASICGSEDVERAREHVLAAMDRCAGLLDHENPFVVLRAAREILQHYRHLCRERFKWTAWSELVEGRDRKRRGVAARARVKDLGRQLAGIRKTVYREESNTEPVAIQDGPSGPHEWQEQLPELRQEGGVPPVCQGGQKPSFDEGAEEYRVNPPGPIDWEKGLHADGDEDDPDERAPP